MDKHYRYQNEDPMTLVTDGYAWSSNETASDALDENGYVWYTSPILHVLGTVVGSALLASLCLLLWRFTTGRRLRAQRIFKKERDENFNRMLSVYESVRLRSCSQLSLADGVLQPPVSMTTSRDQPCCSTFVGTGNAIRITVTDATPKAEDLDINQNVIKVEQSKPFEAARSINDANVDRVVWKETGYPPEQSVDISSSNQLSSDSSFDELDYFVPSPADSPLPPVPPRAPLPVTSYNSMTTNASSIATPTIIQLNDNVFICSSSYQSKK